MASWVLCSPRQVQRQFFTPEPNPERNTDLSISCRTYPGFLVIQGHVYLSSRGKKIKCLKVRSRGQRRWNMATRFILGSRAQGSLSGVPYIPQSPSLGVRGARARKEGWGPGRVTTHLRPPPSSPRTAAAVRSSPWPGSGGSGWDEAAAVLGSTRGSAVLPPPGTPGSLSGHRGRGAAGRGRAGRRGDRRAPAWRGPGNSGAAAAPGP